MKPGSCSRRGWDARARWPRALLVPLALLGLACGVTAKPSRAAESVPVHLWFEPEWFSRVKGFFGYWTGDAKPTGTWGIAGPGISAEWTQGGESEWNSMGVCAAETSAECGREFIVPRAGHYQLWVRYVDHRRQTEPFTVEVEQQGAPAIRGELGLRPVVSEGDEYALYWGFSFGWGHLEGDLRGGSAKLSVRIDKAGENWRQVDAILLTDDASFEPVARRKPTFAYEHAVTQVPTDGAAWRGNFARQETGEPRDTRRSPLGGRDFSMWTQVENDATWWSQQNLESLRLYDVFFQYSAPADVRSTFQTQFAGRRDLPILSWKNLLPGFYLGSTPDLSPQVPLRQWLERSKTPFYILTNYANPQYTAETGPATYQALTGPLADQFLGYIHGEALGSPGVSLPQERLGTTRREHLDAAGERLLTQQAEAWSRIYQTAVPKEHWAKGISCLSVDTIALAHLYHELGAKVVGYEEDSTNVHVPMRIAFQRGAARQYGGAWINYASGNFGDSCNYFTQNPIVPRGAQGWYHSKYAITDGVTATWYRKLYFLNYFGGASAIFWEQALGNQWMQPGPGTHPVQLSPFGRVTEDFQALVDRLPDRGEPVTPVALLLNYAHAYDRVNYQCKMLEQFDESPADRELRELFNVCWYPSGVVEGLPAAPDVQSMPGGVHGNIFDVLVDRPSRARSILNYPVVWAAGDVELSDAWLPVLGEYLRQGGTLVVNIEVAARLPTALTGLQASDVKKTAQTWHAAGQAAQPCVPYEIVTARLAGADALAWGDEEAPILVRNQVGAGAVLSTLVPRLMGLDERAHPVAPYLLNGLTQGLLPIEVHRADGAAWQGEVMYQVNRTPTGHVVLLVNNLGVDKTPSGVARVDRRASVEVLVRSRLAVRSAREYTEQVDVAAQGDADSPEFRLHLPAGDLRVLSLELP